ncbi:unnamed protein product [Amoebophrya sp. A25]|nr:unnamed protein product [Amoebophrya sp. A25]|eukprot:GSA25T00009029001.1
MEHWFKKNVTLFWQDRRTERQSAWLSLQGVAAIVENKDKNLQLGHARKRKGLKEEVAGAHSTSHTPHTNPQKCHAQQDDKVMIVIKIERMEIQDYANAITANSGTNTWLPLILEKREKEWTIKS